MIVYYSYTHQYCEYWGCRPVWSPHNLCLYVCVLPLFPRGNGSICKIISVSSLELLDGNGGLPGNIKTSQTFSEESDATRIRHC